MLYVDTSALVKLYVRESDSSRVVDAVHLENEAIPRTPLHDLEFTNAVQLKRFRRELEPEQGDRLLMRFDEHLERGVYYRPRCDWTRIWDWARRLSHRHTASQGTHSLDILHLAVALEMGARRFLTADERQARLAEVCGLILA